MAAANVKPQDLLRASPRPCKMAANMADGGGKIADIGEGKSFTTLQSPAAMTPEERARLKEREMNSLHSNVSIETATCYKS